MTTQENPSFFAIIPANVRYSNIIPHAKLLYGEITALATKTGCCYASNAYFSSLYGVSGRQVSKWIGELEKGGFIESKIEQGEGNKRYISIVNITGTKVPYPIEQKFHTLGTKVPYPIEQKFLYNNTIINTEINKDIILIKEEEEKEQFLNNKEIDNLEDLRKFLNKGKLQDEFDYKIGTEESFERYTSDFFIFCDENHRKMEKKSIETKFRAYLKPKWETEEDIKIMKDNYRRRKEKKIYNLPKEEEHDKRENNELMLEEIESKMTTEERIELQEKAKQEVRNLIGNKIMHQKSFAILENGRYKKLLLQKKEVIE